MLFSLALAVLTSTTVESAPIAAARSLTGEAHTSSADVVLVTDESERVSHGETLARALVPDAVNPSSVFAAPQASCFSLCGAFDQVCLGGAISKSINGCISWGTLGALCGCLGGMLCGLVPGIMVANGITAVTGGAENAPDGSGALLAFALGGGLAGSFVGAGVGGVFGLLTGPFAGEAPPGGDGGYAGPPDDGYTDDGSARPIRRDRDGSKSDDGAPAKESKKKRPKDRTKRDPKSPSSERGSSRTGDDDRSGSGDDDRSGGGSDDRSGGSENKSTKKKRGDEKPDTKKKREKSDDDDDDDEITKKKKKRSALPMDGAPKVAQAF